MYYLLINYFPTGLTSDGGASFTSLVFRWIFFFIKTNMFCSLMIGDLSIIYIIYSCFKATSSSIPWPHLATNISSPWPCSQNCTVQASSLSGEHIISTGKWIVKSIYGSPYHRQPPPTTTITTHIHAPLSFLTFNKSFYFQDDLSTFVGSGLVTLLLSYLFSHLFPIIGVCIKKLFLTFQSKCSNLMSLVQL